MTLNFRKAKKEDVPYIVAMLANDKLGKLREDYREPLPDKYYRAFDAIDRDKNQALTVVEDESNVIIGCLQLTFMQYLTYQGGLRAQIEAVRIREDLQGKGIGEELFKWAIAKAKENGAHLVQLTTDKKRPDALEFYKKLGFTATHEGMKLHLQD